MRGKRKDEIIEESRRQIDHLNCLISRLCERNDELRCEITELKVQNARLEERLKKYSPEAQENITEAKPDFGYMPNSAAQTKQSITSNVSIENPKTI